MTPDLPTLLLFGVLDIMVFIAAYLEYRHTQRLQAVLDREGA